MLEHVRISLWVVVGHIADAFEVVNNTPNEIVSGVKIESSIAEIGFDSQAVVKQRSQIRTFAWEREFVAVTAE